MSDTDDDKLLKFLEDRAAVYAARTVAREQYRAYRDAQSDFETKRDALQKICPHVDVTECEPYERFEDGHGFPPTRHKARRRCEDCLLEHVIDVRDSPLFKPGMQAQRTLPKKDYDAFGNDGLDSLG